METSIIGPTTRIIWHDPDVNNDENVSYFTKSFSQTEIERFTHYEKVVNFLTEAPGFWIIISSGSKGRKLLELIHESKKVIGIVIFCLNKEFHEKWVQVYPKVKKVAIEIDEVVSEVELLYKRYLLQGVLQVAGEEIKHHESSAISGVLDKNLRKESDIATDLQDVVFHHAKKENQIKFSFVARLLLQDHYHDYPNDILNELKGLNPKEGEFIEQLFHQKRAEHDLLGAIFYLYSTNQIYKQFNEKFAIQAYHELVFTLSVCVHEVRKRPDLKVDPTRKLYRGLRRQCHEKNYIVNGETVYWPAFTSTSLERKEAEKFAGDDGIIFEITLSQANSHPSVVLKQNWSKFPKEKEVLLFPHFAMKVKSKTADGARMLICLEQDEDDGFLSLNKEKLSKYWSEFIHYSVKPNYEASFELMKSKIFQNFRLSEEVVPWMVRRWDFNDVLESKEFEHRLNQFKNYIKKSQNNILRQYIEIKADQCLGKCLDLHIGYLYKETASRLWSLDTECFATEMSVLLEGFANRFIELTHANSNQESSPADLIAKAHKEMSQDWFSLEEKLKVGIDQKLDEIKPQLIELVEKYWEEEKEREEKKEKEKKMKEKD